METISFDRDGPIGWLRLARPEAENALGVEAWLELRDLGRKLCQDSTLRVLVISGEGDSFSCGVDLASILGAALNPSMMADLAATDDGSDRHEDPMAAAVLGAHAAYDWIETAPFAAIAAIHGKALGPGLQLALACDLRVVGRSAKLGFPELDYGVIPDLGGTQRLPRLVGAGRARELILTGRIIDGEEAVRIGLAEIVVDDDEVIETAQTLAAQLSLRPPTAIAGAKRALDAAFGSSTDEGKRVEAQAQAECFRSTDMSEALTAFVQRRAIEGENDSR